MTTTTASETSRPENKSSKDWASLMAMTGAELEEVFQKGDMPRLDALAGWEFRGTNQPSWASLLGIRKFIKGFWRAKDGQVMGYNCPVVQNGLEKRWLARPLDHEPKRFGFYLVEPVDASARDNAYLHAVLLDYGRGGNGQLDPTRGLRDYLVQVSPNNPDLFLGKAYYALGPARVATNFFILERHRKGPESVDLF